MSGVVRRQHAQGPTRRALRAREAPNDPLSHVAVGLGVGSGEDGPTARQLLVHFSRCLAAEHKGEDAGPLTGMVKLLWRWDPSPGTRAVLGAAAGLMSSCRAGISSREVAACLFGLGREPPSAEAEAVVEQVVRLAAAPAPDAPAADSVGLSLYGLRRQRRCDATNACLLVIASMARRCEEPLSPLSIASALQGVSRLGASESAEALAHAIAPLVSECAGRLGSRQLAGALHGTRKMAGHSGGRRILASIAEVVVSRGADLDPADVGEALVGLHHFQESAETRTLLAAVLPLVRGRIGGAAAADGLYGLMRQRGAEGQDLARALVRLAEFDGLSAKDVGCALYGLLDVDASVADTALGAVATAIPRCGDFDPQEISMALFGLHKRGTTPATRAVVEALCPHVSRACGFSAQAVANSLYGLRRQTSTPESHRMLLELDRKVSRCTEPLHSTEVGNSLYGLSGFNSARPVYALLTSLARLTRCCVGTFTTQDVAAALFGLRRQTNFPQTLDVVAALVPCVEGCSAGKTEGLRRRGCARCRWRRGGCAARAQVAA
eukprot:TRINITY_DN9133_c0_g1_i6.p1 TRINITY_DN9133_c0_g1~~TRINITY_DN9133_c0_g1_i6.p1  ORF type:complete len:569 (+),score=149.82 TRINITY_DN9133_c0_g1_i6:53-1708(+)